MTIIAIWFRKKQRDLYAIADSRFTATSQRPLTDRAPKFFPIHILCYAASKNGQYDNKVASCSIGIGFTGSASVAFATITTVQAYAASLVLKNGGSLPSILDIVNLTKDILHENYRSFGSEWGAKSASCEFIIFGSLPWQRGLKAYHISAKSNEKEIVSEAIELRLVDDELCCVFGSAKNYFTEKMNNSMTATGKFEPFNLLSSILASEERADIGGSVQVAIATVGSVLFPHVITPRLDQGEFDSDVTFLGRNVADIGSVGDCSLGRIAVGPDVDALKAMREKAGY